jgi:hypothetical protein
MNTSKLLPSVLVLGVLFALGVSLFRAPVIVNNPITPGAVTGPDSYFPVETHNGVGYEFYKQGLATATTTLCSKRITATSTIDLVTFTNITATSSAATIRVATSTNPTASSTLISTFTVGAARTDAFAYRGKTGDVLYPGQFLNITAEGNQTYWISGACQLITQIH